MLIWLAMRVAIPIHEARISPVLDAARSFLVLEMDGRGEQRREVVHVEEGELLARARRIAELGPQVLICGAVSWPLEAMLLAAGVQLIPNTCGPVEEVLAAFVAGELTGQAFLMPGCPGRRRRQRRHGGEPTADEPRAARFSSGGEPGKEDGP